MNADDRTFMHELLRRHEKATKAMIAELRRSNDEARARFDAVMRKQDREARLQDAWHGDLMEEHRVEREAFLAAIDRLNRLDGGTASA